ncbi:hypothetical protein D3C87_82150 [compost metagenome]
MKKDSRLKKIAEGKRLGEEYVLIENGEYVLNPSIFGETFFTGSKVGDVIIDLDELRQTQPWEDEIKYSFRGRSRNSSQEQKRIFDIASQNGIKAKTEQIDEWYFVDLIFS